MATTAPTIRIPRLLWTALRGFLARTFHAPRDGSHPFDREHHVDTSGLIYAEPLTTGPEGAGYYATAPSLFRGALKHWHSTLAATPHSLDDYTFIDIGSGKGRVLMLASEHPFREVIGIESNLPLANVARRNLARWLRTPRACPHLRVLDGDALTLPIPDGAVVLFFFNAFERELTKRLLDRVAMTAATRIGPIDLIYIHPDFDELVRQTPGVEVLASETLPFSPEDAAADAFGVDSDHIAIYRFGTASR